MEADWTKAALKHMRKLPANIRVRVYAKVHQFAADPSTQANTVKALTGRPESRLRVGDYRVLVTIEDGLVSIMVVHKVRNRREVYD